MAGFIERMHLKGKADEDLYFAKRDKQLIQALHDKQDKQAPPEKPAPEKEQITDIRAKDEH